MASNSETAATSRSRSSSPTKPLVQPHVSAALNDSDLSDEDLEFGVSLKDNEQVVFILLL